MDSMDESKNRFIFQKRQRNYDLSSKSDKTQKYQHLIDKGQFVITLKLKSEKAKLIIKCSAIDLQKEYSICLSLENLKEKYIIFNICKTLEDAYKIFMNLFNNEKAHISKTENTDLIFLNLTIPNYIENKEENICIPIQRKIKLTDCRDSKFLTKMLKENPDITYSYDLIKTIDNLNKKDIAKEREIQKLNLLLNDSLRDISVMKKDIEVMKKKLQIPDMGDVYTEFYKYNNEKKFGNNLDERQKEEEEMEDEEEEDKEYEKEDDTEIRKEKLKKNLMTIKEVKVKEKDSESKGNSNSKFVHTKSTNATPIKTKKENPKAKVKDKDKDKEKEEDDNSNNCVLKFSFIKNVVNKSFVKYYGDNNFVVFESLNGEILLVYTSLNNTMVVYDIENDKIIKSIKDAQKSQISNLRHIRDNIIKRDLLLSISDNTKNIKVWDISNGNCILNLSKVYEDGYIFSACFLIDEINKISYVICINYDCEPLKIYDLEGKIIRYIDNSSDKSYMVDALYHPYLKQYFILVGNEHFIKSYRFSEGTLYKKYFDNSSNLHMYFTIFYKDSKIFLIEVDMAGYFRIWDFDTANIIKKILIKDKLKLKGLCLWNEKYVLIGASDKCIKIIDLNNFQIDNFKCGDILFSLKNFKSSKLGECLLIQGRTNPGVIKMYKCL